MNAPSTLADPPGVLAAIGRTPLVRLDRLLPRAPIAVYGKLELLNPGGSGKDRPALGMLQRALAEGRLRPGGTVVESSSGNMAIALAQAAKLYGLSLICVVDTKTTPTNLRLLQAYGAQLEVITGPHPVTGDWLDARIERVQQILARTPGAFWTDQYTNPANAEAHQHGTAAEIAADLGRAPDFIFAAASTCGTLGGLTRWAQATGAHTRIIAVDVHGSRLFGGPPAPRRVPGIGSSRAPDLLDTSRIEVQMVSDGDCVAGCRHLLQAEALLGGGSAGALVAAAARVLPSAPPGADAVLVLMDRGERYLDTVYDEGWVREAVGEVPELDV
jgi:cysteine synthase A